MKQILGTLLCLFTLLTVHAQAQAVRLRVDETGKTVFYNIPSKVRSVPAGTPLAISQKADNYLDIIHGACDRHGVDTQLVKAIIQVESAYNANAVSPVGAHGLMQLMPATAARFGVTNISDPAQNIEGGVKYLKFLTHLFPNDLSLAVASYNAGEHAIQRFGGVPNYPETRDYVRKVMGLYTGTGFTGFTRTSKPKPPAVFFKFVDEKGITHYTTAPEPDTSSTKLL